ncbi:DUF4417 domain-containing protein [Clostridium sp. 19966]|uniref:DUF4417 domain-containing protein n=1 Tax=Clostridium sp. 19966 TaxID=2768166 RepID=UPI0028DED7D8|nr:DUF4417 domain-containing protein [Clostridium sp. 19966]MDT8718276.1 DUF4417 domain-containing protein [Clostridium sp. 19966]
MCVNSCGRSCKACAINNRCGGCSLCEVSLCRKQCDKCFILCPERPEAFNYLSSISDGSVLLGNKLVILPEHIPIIPDLLKEPPNFSVMPAIAVHAGAMFSRNGEQINRRYTEKGYAGALNIDPRTKAILEFYVKDRTLEGFWDNRKNIYDDLKKLNFYAIIAPNFSVYEDAPRTDHLFNIRRSIEVYNEMIQSGIMAIPDIAWYNINDLDSWIELINKNSIRTIAFSFQVVDVQLKASNLWKSYMLGFRYMCQNIKQEVEIIIAGISAPRRIKEIFAAAGGRKLHVLNQSAYIQSQRGMLSEGRKTLLEIPKNELLKLNIKYFNIMYAQMNKQGGELCQRQGEATL